GRTGRTLEKRKPRDRDRSAGLLLLGGMTTSIIGPVVRCRRMGKGALAPCPPSLGIFTANGGHGARRARLCPPYETFFSTETKNPSVPVRRGVISQPSADCSAASANASALSQSTPAVCSGGTTVNSEWRPTNALTCSPFSSARTEQVM